MSAFADDIEGLDDADIAAMEARRNWLLKARGGGRGGKQLAPTDLMWHILIFLAGRGWGKTDALAQFGWWEAHRTPGVIGHWLGPTNGDTENVGFLGPSGLRAAIPAECLWRGSWEHAYRGSKKPITLTFANRSIIKGFSATEEGGKLRGPQCHFLMGDELREWDKPAGNMETALNNALFGLRLPYPDGTPARALLATTPKPIPALKRLLKRPGVRVVRGTTHENMRNLNPSLRGQLLAMQGTLMGRQEIDGAFIDEESDLSIIKRGWIKLWPKDRRLPKLSFVIESYDCAASEENFDAKKQETDPTACQVWGVFNVAEAFPDEKARRKLGVRGKYGILLLDAWSERLGMPDLLDKARLQHRQKWGPDPGRKADVVLIEDHSSGPALRQMMGSWGVPVWAAKTGRMDKAMRLHATAPVTKQGSIWVPESKREDRAGQPRDWVEPVLEQLCAFAGEGSTEHDDHVDCVAGDTGIITDRGLVAIRDLRKGDMVLTHKGRFRPILEIGSRPSDHFYWLKAKGLPAIQITGNHRVLAARLVASQRKGKEARTVEWEAVDSLRVRPTKMVRKSNGKMSRTARRVLHDGLVLPRMAASGAERLDLMAWSEPDVTADGDWLKGKVGRSAPYRRFLDLDEECGWAMGLFAAEGCVSGHQTIWACDEDAIARVDRWVHGALGRKLSVRNSERVFHGSLGIKALRPLFMSFGTWARNKMVPQWVLEAPIEFVRGFVAGITYGDGCASRGGMGASLTSTSISLIWGVRLLLARLGTGATVGTKKEAGERLIYGRMCSCREAHRLDYVSEGRSGHAVATDDYLCFQVERAERVDEPITVFNMSVEEDESYVTEGGTVHNCFSQAVNYLTQRSILIAEPEVKYLDLEEKREAEEKEALRTAGLEKTARVGNPYAA